MPDGDPEVLLTGFGMEDAQSLANHLTWGPDGWLYGAQRQHHDLPTSAASSSSKACGGTTRSRKEFELFCEGGGNVFGLTFDDDGNLFYSSNLGLFWHAHQGAYYLKNFGKHGPLHNPYAYGHLMHVAHDAPDRRADDRRHRLPRRHLPRAVPRPVPRRRLPPAHRVELGTAADGRDRRPRTFRELLLDSRDTWFGATDLCLGPDGSVYVSDFHDQRTAHPDPDADWDRSNGRIYKIEATGTKPAREVRPRASSRRGNWSSC